MGNWRNRRRFFYRRRSPKSSPSYSFDNEPSSTGFCEDGIPLWEKKFCALIGSIPWHKVVHTRKFMYSNNVLSWDDSAGKEAFQNAKERFWAQINGFQCDICLPDPDIYIDHIDWNPDIDSELIKDLESVYFAPDEGEKDGKVGHRNKRLRYLASVHNKEYKGNSGCINSWECNNDMQRGSVLKDKTQSCNQWNNSNNNLKNINNNYNPWEGNFTRGNDVKDEEQGWKHWNDNKKNNDAKKLNEDDNPWERSLSQGNEALTKNTWGNSGDKLWGWNQGLSHVNPWEQSCQGVDPVKDNKGLGDLSNSSSCWSQQKSWMLDSGDNPGKCKFSKYARHPEDSRGHTGDRGWRENWRNAWYRGWKDDGGNAQDSGWRNNVGDAWGGWKQWDNHCNDAKHLELGRSDGNWGAWNGNCRKREGSQLTSYKSSAHQPEDNPSRQCWRSRKANNRM